MGSTLLDQLKKTGLVDEKKVQKVKQQQHQQKKKGKKKEPKTESVKQYVKRVQAEKAARDKQLNLLRNQEKEQKSQLGQLRQLVHNSCVKEKQGEVRFHFNDNNKVQRLFVTEQVRDQLSSGAMVIVKCDHRYEIIPKAIGEKISKQDPSLVISVAPAKNTATEADDPYAQYQVPDDLMW